MLTQREMDNLRLNEMGSLNDHITRLGDQIVEMEISRDAKRKQAESDQFILGEKLTHLSESILTEREECNKWKNRFNTEQKAHKETQQTILHTASEQLDYEKRENEIQFKVKNLEQMKALNQKEISDWQEKYNNSNEEVQDLIRQVAAARKMRDMLGKVKEEKIRLVRRNMSDLKGTYEKFLMQNAMAGEDVRSEAMRTLEKWNDAKSVIRALEEKLEEARILDIKKETKWRKERESYEMAIEDYDNECHRYMLDVGVGE